MKSNTKFLNGEDYNMSLKSLIKSYLDKYGRMDLKAVNGGEPSTNNQLLYSGELAILMYEYNKYFKHDEDMDLFTQDDFDNLMNGIKSSVVPGFPGLLSRHPDPYRIRLPLNGRPVSFDEILGASFVAGFSDPHFAELIVRHGEKYNWQYCDVPFYEKGGKLSKLFYNPIKTSVELYKYLKSAMSYEKDGLRKASQSFTWFYPLFFTHGASERHIYLAAAGAESSVWNQLSFLAAVFVASHKSDNVSSKALWIFRFKFLEAIGRETWITKKAKNFFMNMEVRRYGPEFERAIFKLYYTDSNHPFHWMVKYARLK